MGACRLSVANQPNANMAQDLTAIEDVEGVPMVSKLRRDDLKDPELQRHGDSAVMLALGWFATLNLHAPIGYIAVPTHPRGFDNLQAGGMREDLDFPLIEHEGW